MREPFTKDYLRPDGRRIQPAARQLLAQFDKARKNSFHFLKEEGVQNFLLQEEKFLRTLLPVLSAKELGEPPRLVGLPKATPSGFPPLAR